MSKDVVVCVQSVLEKKKFVVQFEDGQKREMSDSSLSCVCEKDQVGKEADKTISGIPKRVKGGLLTINWYTFC